MSLPMLVRMVSVVSAMPANAAIVETGPRARPRRVARRRRCSVTEDQQLAAGRERAVTAAAAARMGAGRPRRALVTRILRQRRVEQLTAVRSLSIRLIRRWYLSVTTILPISSQALTAG
jgi:hypothetical protein